MYWELASRPIHGKKPAGFQEKLHSFKHWTHPTIPTQDRLVISHTCGKLSRADHLDRCL